MNKQKYPFNNWMTPLDERKVAAFHDKIYDQMRAHATGARGV
jgi:hypothetical protein